MKRLYTCLMLAFFLPIIKMDAALSGHAFVQLSNFATQFPDAKGNSKIRLESIDAIKNIEISPQREEVIIKQGGAYFFLFSCQVGATHPGLRGYVDVWMIKNNKPLPNSGARMSLENMSSTGTLVNQYVLELKNGDVISMGFSASGPGLGLIYIKPDNEPAVPSLSFSLFKIDNG